MWWRIYETLHSAVEILARISRKIREEKLVEIWTLHNSPQRNTIFRSHGAMMPFWTSLFQLWLHHSWLERRNEYWMLIALSHRRNFQQLSRLNFFRKHCTQNINFSPIMFVLVWRTVAKSYFHFETVPRVGCCIRWMQSWIACEERSVTRLLGSRRAFRLRDTIRRTSAV